MMLNATLRFFCAAVLCCVALTSQAQLAAPTLTAGLSSVTGQRGDLDVELLSQIVSEKQEEVKRELLQRKILNEMDGESIALQNFVYSSFYALLSYSDKKAIEKELLKQVSILALQVGFAEAFLRLSFIDPHTNDSLLHQFRLLIRDPANSYADAIDIDTTIVASTPLRKAMRSYLHNAYGLSDAPLNEAYAYLVNQLKRPAFSKLFSLDRYMEAAARHGRNGDPGCAKHCDETTAFSSVLLDIVYDAVQVNQTLQERGFCHLHPNLALRYDSLNLYKDNRVKLPASGSVRQGRAQHVDFSELHAVIASAMGLFVEYHTLFFDFADDMDFSIGGLYRMRSGARSEVKLDSLLRIVDHIVIDLSQQLERRTDDRRLSPASVNDLEADLGKIITGMDEFRRRAEAPGAAGQAHQVRVRDYYFVRQHVDPFVAKLIALGLIDNKGIQTVQLIKQRMFDELLKELDRTIDRTPNLQLLDELAYSKYGPLIKIISTLSRLDEVKSYEHVFNTLGQLGFNSIGDTRLRFIQDIVYYVDAYATINRDSNLINLEIEGLLLKMLSIYENRASGNFQMYFGVGLGQTLAIGYEHNDVNRPLLVNDSTTLSNLSFASEKIGLKYKVLNNRKRQVMDRPHSDAIHRTTQPIVSDYYVFTYGSGLLYNVANLTSAGKNFDHVMVGLGGGVAFFNSLDVNVWIAAPMVGGESFGESLVRRRFFGFSFDVKLTEYLTALGEKRRKTQLTR